MFIVEVVVVEVVDVHCRSRRCRRTSLSSSVVVGIYDDVAIFDGPTKFKSTHSLTGDKVKFKTHGPIGAVVSFTITPVDGDGNVSVDPIAAVCIDVAGAADPLVDNSPQKSNDDDDDDDD